MTQTGSTTVSPEFEQVHISKKRLQEMFAAEIYMTSIMGILCVDTMHGALHKIKSLRIDGVGPVEVRA